MLTAWNGLMIAAFARFARVKSALAGGSEAGQLYLDAARRAASFIHERMWHESSQTLLRRFRAGHAEIDAYAEDYAYMVFGLLELFQADPDVVWLEWASTLQRRQDALFWDATEGGWFSTTGHDPSVLVRMKEDYDGAEPAASSVSVLNLLVLSHLIEDSTWSNRIEETLRLFGPRLVQAGRAVPMMAAALSTYAAGIRQVVIVGDVGAGVLEHAVMGRYDPFVVTFSLSDARRDALARLVPFVAAMQPVGGRAAAYVCRDFSCRQPVVGAQELQKELGR
jgi:hypothetical protein